MGLFDKFKDAEEASLLAKIESNQHLRNAHELHHRDKDMVASFSENARATLDSATAGLAGVKAFFGDTPDGISGVEITGSAEARDTGFAGARQAGLESEAVADMHRLKALRAEGTLERMSENFQALGEELTSGFRQIAAFVGHNPGREDLSALSDLTAPSTPNISEGMGDKGFSRN